MSVRTAATEAVSLLLPVECVGCGRWDVSLCEECEAVLRRRPVRCEQQTVLLSGAGTRPVLPTWSVGPYRGVLRAAVLGWKTHRRSDIAPRVLRAAADVAAQWSADPDLGELLGDEPCVVVVPAPSGWRRRLARRLVVADLADAVARGLASGAPGPRELLVADVLRRRGGPAHQAGTGARGRVVNRDGTVRCRAGLPAGTAVLLVDDVVTTGATLSACAEAVRAAGGRPVAAFTLASTESPTGSGRALRGAR